MQKIYIVNKNEFVSQDIILKAKIDQIKLDKQKDKQLFVFTQLLEKYILNGRERLIGEFGKPYADKGSRYNISQVGDYVVAIESDKECGVDIVDKRAFDEHFKSRMYKKSENIASDEDAQRAWSIKEACLKCVGIGLKGLFDVEIISKDEVKYKDQVFEYRTIMYDNYAISICMKNGIEDVSLVKLTLKDII